MNDSKMEDSEVPIPVCSNSNIYDTPNVKVREISIQSGARKTISLDRRRRRRVDDDVVRSTFGDTHRERDKCRDGIEFVDKGRD